MNRILDAENAEVCSIGAGEKGVMSKKEVNSPINPFKDKYCWNIICNNTISVFPSDTFSKVILL